GFRQGTDDRQVQGARVRHRLGPRADCRPHGPHQLPDGPLPHASQGPSRAARPPEDGRQAAPPPDVHEADGRDRLPPDRAGARAPSL
ncbi:MAG: SSU ribosomal protein S15p (S13e), partial [uncultured Solirubrobacteraceae bacterium]